MSRREDDYPQKISRIDDPPNWGKLYQSPLPNYEDLEHIDGQVIIINLCHSMPRTKLLNPEVDEMAVIFRLPKTRSKVSAVFEFWLTDNESGVLPNTELVSLAETISIFIVNGVNVLINCAAGISRSSYVSLASLMNLYNISFHEAFDYLREIRPSCDPHGKFRDHLRKCESLLTNHFI